ncbi:hypothetical protein BH23THE1_BH23THE1_34290 [soil metagenome]
MARVKRGPDGSSNILDGLIELCITCSVGSSKGFVKPVAL